MKTQTNNSLFTDIELDKAADVNGGWSTYTTEYLSRLNRYQDSYYRSTSPFYNGYRSSGFSTSAGYALYLLSQR